MLRILALPEGESWRRGKTEWTRRLRVPGRQFHSETRGVVSGGAGGLKEPARDAPCHRVNLTEDFTSLLPEPRTLLGIQQVFKKHLPEGHNKHHCYLTATRVTTLANFPQSELRRGARCRLGTSPTCEARRDGSRLLQFLNLHWWLQRTRWRSHGCVGGGQRGGKLGTRT